MKSVLIISSIHAQVQHVQAILLRYPSKFQIMGTADNSVLGMSMIESSSPDIVIMPTYMNFWNAEDLIVHLLPRGITPQFVLIQESGDPFPGGAAAQQVAAVLPDFFPTETQLISALEGAVRRQEEQRPSSGSSSLLSPAIQHSLEVMELMMGLTPVRTGAAQMEFGRLQVGQDDCWLLLGAPQSAETEHYNFFSQLENLEMIFERLNNFFAPLGRSELCIYREDNLCILLTGQLDTEPDWNALCKSVNGFLAPFGVPELLFEISDAPLSLEHWHSQCQKLLELREKRFFHSPLFLQRKLLRNYQTPVTQNQIYNKLSSLSLAMQNRNLPELIRAIQTMEEMVSHSLSLDLYSFVSTRLVILYGRLRYSHGLQENDTDFPSLHFSSVAEAFQSFQALFVGLYDQLGTVHGSSNELIVEACSYINQNLQEPLTLEQLAKHIHVSPTYLSRLFKRETGSAFNNYVNQRRILRAIQLLETRYKITDIAGMVGFDNAKYFSQVFRKHVGKTPQQYRKELRGDDEQ